MSSRTTPDADTAALQARLLELRTQKFRLLRRLAREESLVKLEGIIDEAYIQTALGNDISSDRTKQPDVAGECLSRQYEDYHTGYQVTGRTAFPVTDDVVGIRLETFYQGSYYEPYFFFLRMAGTPPKLTLFRHTLPPIVDLDPLRPLLNQDIHTFLDRVDPYLQALVARREQVNRAAQALLLQTIDTNDGFTHVKFTVKTDASPVHGYVVYDPPSLARPSQVLLVRPDKLDDPDVGRLSDREQLFYRLDLDKALAEAFF